MKERKNLHQRRKLLGSGYLLVSRGASSVGKERGGYLRSGGRKFWVGISILLKRLYTTKSSESLSMKSCRVDEGKKEIIACFIRGIVAGGR